MNILTFDIEEWFHILDHHDDWLAFSNWNNLESRVEELTEKLLMLLKLEEVHATFFIVGWVAKKFPNLVRLIHSHGHEIASHSHYHRLCYELNWRSFSDDLQLSLNVLEDIIGEKVTTYRAPGFSVIKESTWVLEALRMNGILNDCSIFSASRRHGGMLDWDYREPFIIETQFGDLCEFPMSYARVFKKRLVFSGGGYLRITPKPLLTYLFKKLDYNMVYMHPRDYDKEQPVIKSLPRFRRLKHYVGIGSSYQKLQSLLKNDFVTVAQANELLNSKLINRVTLNDN